MCVSGRVPQNRWLGRVPTAGVSRCGLVHLFPKGSPPLVGDPPNPWWPRLAPVTPAETLFPNKALFRGAGRPWIWGDHAGVTDLCVRPPSPRPVHQSRPQRTERRAHPLLMLGSGGSCFFCVLSFLTGIPGNSARKLVFTHDHDTLLQGVRHVCSLLTTGLSRPLLLCYLWGQ